MRRIAMLLVLFMGMVYLSYAGTNTTNLNLYKPAVDETGWGEAVNNNTDVLDVAVGTKLNINGTWKSGALSSSDVDNALGYTPENVFNKENSTIDTSITKYPTVNLLKTGLDTKQNVLVFDVKTYGAMGNGTTDDSTAVLAAITAAYNAGGGIVFFPKGTYRIDSQIALPNDGKTYTIDNVYPQQPTIHLMGVGEGGDPAWLNGSGFPIAQSPSVLDLRYAGTIAKIVTKGKGLLEISNLQLQDTTDGILPFIFTTNTTVYLHDASVVGKTEATVANYASMVQDIVVFGGTNTAHLGGLDNDAPFQGYGSSVKNCYFANIRKIKLQAFANAVVIKDNFWGLSCGGDCAIDLSGDTGGITGNSISGNIVEMPHYNYAVKLNYANDNFFLGNWIGDTSTPSIAFWNINNSTGNIIVCAHDSFSGTSYTSNQILASGDYTRLDSLILGTLKLSESPSTIKFMTDADTSEYYKICSADTNTGMQYHHYSGHKFYCDIDVTNPRVIIGQTGILSVRMSYPQFQLLSTDNYGGTIDWLNSSSANLWRIGTGISVGSGPFEICNGDSTNRFLLATSGALKLPYYGAGTATFDASGNISSSSDERLKNIQGNLSYGLKEVLQINPILYKWNKKSGLETEHVYAGFSAQEIRKLIPETVGIDKNGYFSLSDRGIEGALVNAVKELNAKIQELENKLAKYEITSNRTGDK